MIDLNEAWLCACMDLWQMIDDTKYRDEATLWDAIKLLYLDAECCGNPDSIVESREKWEQKSLEREKRKRDATRKTKSKSIC